MDETALDNITKKASNTLNFVTRNLKYCPKQYKEVAYFSLVRSSVEYGCVVWDPHINKENQHLTVMYKVGLRSTSRLVAAVPTTQLIPADSSTRSNHNFKFRSIGSNSTPYRYSNLPTNNSYLESPPSHDRRSHVTSVDVFKRRLP